MPYIILKFFKQHIQKSIYKIHKTSVPFNIRICPPFYHLHVFWTSNKEYLNELESEDPNFFLTIHL